MSDRVLVTGISGFIALHVAKDLLVKGYRVRGTVRYDRRAEAVRSALRGAGAAIDKLELVTADLESTDDWTDIVADCRYVQHIAAPFPLIQPKRREDLVPVARDGALKVLKAANAVGVERVVMTSSIVAMMYRKGLAKTFTFQPGDWTDPEWAVLTPYVVAKTRAERAAWDHMMSVDREQALTCVNPGLVLGPALDARIGTSLEVVSLLMRGAYPAVPPVAFPVVDVRDVAQVHIAAMTAATGGRRLIAAADTLSMADMGRALRQAFPDRKNKIPTSELSLGMVGLVSLFDASLKTLRADLGKRPMADNRETTALTGVRFRDSREALIAAAQSLTGFGRV